MKHLKAKYCDNSIYSAGGLVTPLLLRQILIDTYHVNDMHKLKSYDGTFRTTDINLPAGVRYQMVSVFTLHGFL